MNLNEAKLRFKNEWIAFKILNEDNKENPEGEVILHKKNKREFNKELLEKKIINVYITYNGPVVKGGYSIVFNIIG